MKVFVLAVAVSMLMPISMASPAEAMIGDIYEDSDVGRLPDQCGFAPGARLQLQMQVGDAPFAAADFPVTSDDWLQPRADKNGCVGEVTTVTPARLAPAGATFVNLRIASPPQTIKRGDKRVKVNARTGDVTQFKVWPMKNASPSTPVPHISAFGAKYGDLVATIVCKNPWGRGGQGSGFAVRVSLHPSAVALNAGSTYLVTAGHVIRDCHYSNYNDVTVIYKGQSYPGKAYGSWTNPDIGTVMTTAPVPSADLAGGAANRPNVGDTGVSIGVAGGIVGTTTQGAIAGVGGQELNTTIPSGPGASGGPVFNNQGKVIGLIIAGSGSLTVATALPTFCGTVYVNPCQASW